MEPIDQGKEPASPNDVFKEIKDYEKEGHEIFSNDESVFVAKLEKITKQLPYYFSEADIFIVFDTLDIGDESHKQTCKKLLKKHQKVTASVFNSFWVKYQIKNKTGMPIIDSTINYESVLSGNETIYLVDDGCFIQKITEKGVFYDYNFKWDSIELQYKYQLQITEKIEESPVVYFYDFKLNGELFYSFKFDQMKQIIISTSFQGKNGKATITDVLSQYCKDVDEIDISKSCGFFEYGWDLPPRSQFRPREGNMRESLIFINQMMEIKPDKELAIKYFNELYEMTNITYKGIIFAYFMGSPFHHVLKHMLGIMPQLAMGGLWGEGKSKVTEIGCKKIWNIPLLSADSAKSISRLLGSMAMSTFPIGIDDAQKMGKSFADIMKTHATLLFVFKRKKGQDLLVNTVLYSNVISNFNQLPPYLKDRANRDRLIYLEPTLTKKTKNWILKLNLIPDGLIGRYVIEQTKDWNENNILEYIRDLNVSDYSNDRDQNIYRILKFGSYLTKLIFGIDLNLDQLPEVLGNSKVAGTDQLFESIKYMVIESYKMKFQGKSATTWVRSGLETKYRRGSKIHGFIIDSTRKVELMKQYDYADSVDTGLEILSKTLEDQWNNPDYPVDYTILSVNRVKTRCIFIPSFYIIGENTNLVEYFQKPINIDKYANYSDSELEAEEKKSKGIKINLDKDFELPKTINKEVEIKTKMVSDIIEKKDDKLDDLLKNLF